MSPRKASIRVAHARACPMYGKSSIDSIDGCKCQPSYFTLYTGRNEKQVRGPRVKNKRVAERALQKLQVELDENRAKVAAPKSKTFTQWVPIWHERVEAGGWLREETIRQYLTTAKFADEVFGNHPLREIGDDELFAFVRACQARKQKPRTIDKHLRHLHGLFQAAIGARLLGENPLPVFRSTFKLALEPSQANYFTDGELATLWRQFTIGIPKKRDGKDIIVPVPAVYLHMSAFAVATGMRAGELSALTWADVDLDGGSHGEIHITKAWHQRDGIQKPKTRSSIRTIHLIPDARRILEAWTPILLELAGSVAIEDTALVFPTPQGGHIGQSNLANKVITPVMAAAGVAKVGEESPEPRSFHTFRHCYARLMLEGGLPLQWVSTEMGHASTAITEQVYAHWTRKAKQDVAATVPAGLMPV